MISNDVSSKLALQDAEKSHRHLEGIANSTHYTSLYIPTTILNDGNHMPMAGIGMCCRDSATGDAARQATVDFLKLGGRHIDTARMYHNEVQHKNWNRSENHCFLTKVRFLIIFDEKPLNIES